MFRTLLVALDGSELAERALPYATALASAAGGKLVLVRVALAPAPATLDGATWEQDQSEAVAEAEQYLVDVAAKVRTRVRAETCVPYGRPAPCIVNSIADMNADAVVMATHGRTGLKHLLVGSVAEAVIAGSAVPVFVTYARPGEAPAPPFDPAHARVIVPLDGSDFAPAALPTAVELVGPSGELVLVSVVESSEEVVRDEFGRIREYLDQQEEALTSDARDYLHDVADQLVEKHPGLHVTVEVRIGAPAAGIIAVAADRVADLVVMASHGRTGIPRAVFGSVTGAVLRDGFTPVMVVHPRIPAAGDAMPEPLDERMATHF
jgi:nucleotide-binding universal stress UspA family protein